MIKNILLQGKHKLRNCGKKLADKYTTKNVENQFYSKKKQNIKLTTTHLNYYNKILANLQYLEVDIRDENLLLNSLLDIYEYLITAFFFLKSYYHIFFLWVLILHFCMEIMRLNDDVYSALINNEYYKKDK